MLKSLIGFVVFFTTLLPAYAQMDKEHQPVTEKRDVDILLFGTSRHHGSPAGKFNENNPGFGFRVNTGTCFWEYFDCHVGAVYIAKNSVNGQLWSMVGGVKKDIFQVGRVTGLLGLEAGLAAYEFPLKGKTYYLPIALPYGELKYSISKDTSFGVGKMWIPTGQGRSIEITYFKFTLRKNFL